MQLVVRISKSHSMTMHELSLNMHELGGPQSSDSPTSKSIESVDQVTGN